MFKTAIQIGNLLKIQIEEEDFVTFFRRSEILTMAAKKSAGRNVSPFYRESKAGGFYFGLVDIDTGEELTFHVRKEGKGFYVTDTDEYRAWRQNPNDQGEADTSPQGDPPQDSGEPPSDFDPVPQPARRPAAPAARTAQPQQRQGPPRPPATRQATSGGGGW